MGESGSQWEKLARLGTAIERNGPFNSFILKDATPSFGLGPQLADSIAVVYTGTYHRSLDSKLRVLLPKRLRQAHEPLSELFLTPGTDHCLELHTAESLDELAQEARKLQSGRQTFKSFARLFYARARCCDIDRQGRIRIPVELAELAEFEKEIVFVGVGFHWEVWNLERWEDYIVQNNTSFDEISQSTFDPPRLLSIDEAEQLPVPKQKRGTPK